MILLRRLVKSDDSNDVGIGVLLLIVTTEPLRSLLEGLQKVVILSDLRFFRWALGLYFHFL